MKIWKEFGSSHSGNISVIGTFTDTNKAVEAFEMVKDFTLGFWEERHESVDKFLEFWSERFHPELINIQITETDYKLGVDNDPDIKLFGNQIRISQIRSNNVGGIIKLMLFAGAKNADVANNDL